MSKQFGMSRKLLQVPKEKGLTPLLEWLGMAVVPASTEKFVANDNFKLQSAGGICFYLGDFKLQSAGGICTYIGDNFKAWFMSGAGKIEEPTGEQRLRFAKLTRSAHDVPLKEGEQAIIPELGGEAKAETALLAIYSLMKKQADGGEGVLLANGWANIFYVKDLSEVFRAVDVYRSVDGWRVNAFSVEDPDGWRDGRRVFSRISARALKVLRLNP